MPDDPVVDLANRLADDAATYRQLFRATLAVAHLHSVQIAQLKADLKALRAELARYVSSKVGA